MSYQNSIHTGDRRVQDICAALGYKEKSTSSPRCFRKLSVPAGKYRQAFVKASKGLIRFPLAFDDPLVRQCVSEFLTQYRSLFEESDEAYENGWPMIPRHTELICSKLGKLMCSQESLKRKNDQLGSKRKRQYTNDDDVDEDSNDNDNDSDGDPHDDIRDVPSRPVRAVERLSKRFEVEDSSSDEDPEDQEWTNDTNNHLEFTYPMISPKVQLSKEWIITSGPWPDNVLPWAFRYLHEHHLYNSQKQYMELIQRFKADLKFYLDIECTENEDYEVYDRCRNFISSSSKRWTNSCRFLQKKKDGFIVRRAAFESAWKLRRELWLNHHSHDLADPTSEYYQADSGASANVIEDNYQMQPETSVRLPRQLDGALQPPKRLRTKASPPVSFHSLQQIETGETIRVAHCSDAGTGDGTKMIISARAAGSHLDLASGSQFEIGLPSPVISMGGDKEQHFQNSPLRNEPSISHRQHTSSSSSSSPSPNQPNNHTHILRDRAHGTDLPEVENSARPHPSPNSMLQTPRSVNTSGLQPIVSAGSPAPPVPLLLIIERRKGTLDWDHPVPREEWRDLDLGRFFNFICQRSRQLSEHVFCLTFSYDWGKYDKDDFLVKICEGNQRWEEIKERIKKIFFDAKKRMPGRTDFQIWVRSGDLTQVQLVEPNEEEEGW